MGDSIPLSIFKTFDNGLKLYLDKDCTVEENYNNQDKLKPFYTIEVDNLRRGKTKEMVRYVKNIGYSQTLFALYYSDNYNLNISFINEKGESSNFANGVLGANRVAKIVMNIDILDLDNKAKLNLHLVGRQLKTN